MRGRFRPGVFWGSGVKRASVALLAVAFVVFALLPRQSQFLFHQIGQPFADLVAIPLEGMATLDRDMREWWMQYIALQGLSEQNRELRKKVQRSATLRVACVTAWLNLLLVCMYFFYIHTYGGIRRSVPGTDGRRSVPGTDPFLLNRRHPSA